MPRVFIRGARRIATLTRRSRTSMCSLCRFPHYSFSVTPPSPPPPTGMHTRRRYTGCAYAVYAARREKAHASLAHVRGSGDKCMSHFFQHVHIEEYKTGRAYFYSPKQSNITEALHEPHDTHSRCARARVHHAGQGQDAVRNLIR